MRYPNRLRPRRVVPRVSQRELAFRSGYRWRIIDMEARRLRAMRKAGRCAITQQLILFVGLLVGDVSQPSEQPHLPSWRPFLHGRRVLRVILRDFSKEAVVRVLRRETREFRIAFQLRIDRPLPRVRV